MIKEEGKKIPPAIFGVVGWSGSGKTTLIERLIPIFNIKKIQVSTLKHAHHVFDIDQPGKDSFRHRKAGAVEVLIASDQRWALMHENIDAPEEKLEDLILHMTPVDLVLVEGYKTGKHSKIEVNRYVAEQPLLCFGDSTIVAAATDHRVKGVNIPQLDLGDTETIADFIIKYCGLE